MDDNRIAEIRARVEAATPGKWFWNSYSGIFSADLVQRDGDAPDYPNTPRPGPPFFTPEDNEWLAKRAAAYEADCTVAWVPAHYGDTATGRHAADAELIAEAPIDLADLLAALDAARAEVARLRPVWDAVARLNEVRSRTYALLDVMMDDDSSVRAVADALDDTNREVYSAALDVLDVYRAATEAQP